MTTCMICASQELHVVGRTEWRAPRIGYIVADGCPCLRLLDYRPRAGERRAHDRETRTLGRQRVQKYP
jgi:hypothetical protein